MNLINDSMILIRNRKIFFYFMILLTLLINVYVSPVYQTELADLQCNPVLKFGFQQNDIIYFYKSLDDNKFANLKDLARSILSIFGSMYTYICEQTFSKMKNVKCPLRSRMTDGNLHDMLRMSTTKMDPRLELIINDKQFHTSH